MRKRVWNLASCQIRLTSIASILRRSQTYTFPMSLLFSQLCHSVRTFDYFYVLNVEYVVICIHFYFLLTKCSAHSTKFNEAVALAMTTFGKVLGQGISIPNLVENGPAVCKMMFHCYKFMHDDGWRTTTDETCWSYGTWAFGSVDPIHT